MEIAPHVANKGSGTPIPALNDMAHGDFFDLQGSVRNESIHLVVCDGPYGITGTLWGQISRIQEFNLELIQILSELLVDGGAQPLFGKSDSLDCIDDRPYLTLKSRIIGHQPSRLAQGRKSHTINYDVIPYSVKGNSDRCFNVGDIRVPQLVEREHKRRCENVPSVIGG